MKTNMQKITCLNSGCGETLPIARFYKINPKSQIHKQYAGIGVVPICRGCLRSMCQNKDGTYNIQGIKKALEWLDRPYVDEMIMERIRNGKFDIGILAKDLAINKKYNNMTYANSEFNTIKKDDNSSVILSMEEDEPSDFEVTKEMVKFWGNGNLQKEDYEFLENEFKNLSTRFVCDSYSQEMLFQEIAYQRLDIKKKRQQGTSVDKELKTLQDLLGSANIKPVQETGANSAEQSTFGVLIKKWENERPIPEPDPLWADVDGIRRYINVWFLGHLCKMLNIRNDYSEMYEKEMQKYRVELPDVEEDEGGSNE